MRNKFYSDSLYRAYIRWAYTSRTKTKLQYIGSGPQPSPVDIHGNTDESTDCFIDLSSQLHSSGCSTTEIFRSIGIALSVMGRLVHTKMRFYNALVVSPTIRCRNMDNVEIRQADNRGLPHVHASAAFLGYAGMTSSRMPKLSIEHVKRSSPHK